MAGERDHRLDRFDRHGRRVVARYSWFDGDGHRRTGAQVLTMRNGRVVGIQDYRSPARAAAAARLLAFA